MRKGNTACSMTGMVRVKVTVNAENCQSIEWFFYKYNHEATFQTVYNDLLASRNTGCQGLEVPDIESKLKCLVSTSSTEVQDWVDTSLNFSVSMFSFKYTLLKKRNRNCIPHYFFNLPWELRQMIFWGP